MVTIAHSGLARTSSGSGTELTFQRGAGGIVFDVNGREYLDFILGYGSVVLGHSHAGFLKRLHDHLHNGILLPGYSSWHERLLAHFEPLIGDNFVAAFFKTGSESVTAAIRLASQLSSKKAIIRCGFIGWHDAELGKSVRWHEPLNSPLRYQLRFMQGFRGISGDEEVLNWISLDLNDLVSLVEANVANIACFVIDTYQLRFVNQEVIKAAIEVCKANDIYVIADETKIAGRVSPLGFAADFSWDVDFRIVGKALANGSPLSILLGKPHLMAVSEAARITGTFSQEMTAIFCALATVDEMDECSGYDILRSAGRQVTSAFNAAAEGLGVQEFVQAEALFRGEMLDLRFSAEVLPKWDCRQTLCSMMGKYGVLILQGHPSHVCLPHASLDFTDLLRRFEQALAEWSTKCIS